MLPFIAASTTAAKVQSIPPAVWLKIGGAILVLVLIVVVLRKVAKMNKIVLGILTLLVVSIVGFNWIYERNEPAWATPVIEPLSKFFPSKGALK